MESRRVFSWLKFVYDFRGMSACLWVTSPDYGNNVGETYGNSWWAIAADIVHLKGLQPQ